MHHPSLFQPLILSNGVTLENRLAVAPLTHYGSNPDGSFSDEEYRFLKGLARGFGMFIMAATLVSREGWAFVGQPLALSERDIPELVMRARMVQECGSKAILQLHHGGFKAQRSLMHDGVIYGASDDFETGARQMSTAQVRHLAKAFGNAAALAIEAGFDGVEIHGANGYALQQFYSAQTNLRTDCYGGSREGRMRLLLEATDEVCEAREKAKARNFIIGYRFSPEEPGAYGLDMQDTYALIDELKYRPLQYLHVSQHDFYKHVRRGDDTAKLRVQAIHERIGGIMPLMGVGHLDTGEDLEKALATGYCELVATGRSVMLNRNLVDMIKEGRDSEIEKLFHPMRPDHYDLPDYLYARCCEGGEWLPPVSGREQSVNLGKILGYADP